ncbi:MAG: 50S ribosomal protein L19 [Omnitrophica WOR_2 bacterium RIFCSPLOWO2_02_FULL_63_16]|nr:MAG: 50S ribosomal protein L19 [Omnitrophica WOR_2 bacterium RIFCSPLOWO2_02_FULL_63_16]
MNAMDRVTQTSKKASAIPDFGPGDEVRVWCRIREKGRVRQVPFEGLVIRRRGGGISETCTVRRMTHGEGVERVFPLHAPVVERIEVLRQGKVRRARLYYLRTKVGKTKIASSEAPGPTAQSAAPAPATPPPSPAPTPAS